jgi:serine/threonine protein kinase
LSLDGLTFRTPTGGRRALINPQRQAGPAPNAPLTKQCGTCGSRLEATLQRCPSDGTRLPREHPETAVLGSYRLVERLGSGGMGVVYRAVHVKLGRTVAIKILNRSLLADRTNVARFFQEARSVNTIRHPNVVDIYDFVTAGRDIYTVMEFLVGRDLHHAIYAERGPFAPDRAVTVLIQICAGLQAVHDRNIIHRDLKPANVFLTRRGRDELVKLLDFGLAKLERAEGRMTRDGVVLGTPEYMAPEQARGTALDSRTDIYGVGCLAYHMLTGSQLFAGGGYAEVMVRHVKEAPPPLRTLNPALPEALERVVLRALAKDPAGRPASAHALAEELSAAIGRPLESFAVVPGRPRSTGTPALDDRKESTGTYSAVVSRTLGSRRPGRLPVALAALVVLLLAGAGLALTSRRAPVAIPVATRAVAAPATASVVRPGEAVSVALPAEVVVLPVRADWPPAGGGPRALPVVRPPPRHLAKRHSRAHAPDAVYLDSRARTINPFGR